MHEVLLSINDTILRAVRARAVSLARSARKLLDDFGNDRGNLPVEDGMVGSNGASETDGKPSNLAPMFLEKRLHIIAPCGAYGRVH